MIIEIKKLSNKATTPVRHLEGAGLDIFTAEETIIPAHSAKLIKTDLQIKIPNNHMGLLMGRSGVSLNANLIIHSGIIDQDYRGNIGIIIHNLNKENIKIKSEKKIAQLIIIPIIQPIIKIVDSMDKTERDQKGFGSSDLP